MPLDRVLLVDDEEEVLNGLKRSLFRDFDVHVAVGGEAGLVAVRDSGPFSVIVSDMRMPRMNGAVFLAKVRVLQPLSTRILLTGYSDAEAAAEAINHGQISQFLTKPCPREELLSALNKGVKRCKELNAEKALLEDTLIGCIRTLSEVLSAVSPLSFERSTRMGACVKHLIAMIPLEQPWQIEAAALLSQIGCMALAPEMVRSAHRGLPLSQEEAERYTRHPNIASDLLIHIPRMQGVVWMIRNQNGTQLDAVPAGLSPGAISELCLGAEMLRMAIVFDTLWLQGLHHAEIIVQIGQSIKNFPHCLLDALATMKPYEKVMTPRLVPVALISEDMIVDEDLTNHVGALLVGTGQPISRALMVKLKEYSAAGTIGKAIRVLA